VLKISGYVSNERQGTLFAEPLRGHGHVRAVIGNLAENLTAEFVGGKRHKTDSTADYCPDVSRGRGRWREYFESKAVGQSGQLFVYEKRLYRDAMFSEKHRLSYIVWRNDQETKDAETVEELEQGIIASMRCVYFIPFQELHKVLAGRPVVKLNSKYGGTDRETYGTGYRIALSAFDGHIAQRFPEGVFDVVRHWWWGRS
jgi:hypothetical protein